MLGVPGHLASSKQSRPDGNLLIRVHLDGDTGLTYSLCEMQELQIGGQLNRVHLSGAGLVHLALQLLRLRLHVPGMPLSLPLLLDGSLQCLHT